MNQLTSGNPPGRAGWPREKIGPPRGRLAAAEGDQACTKRVRTSFRWTSLQSNQEIGVVLAIGVVVALLRAAAFVAEKDHRHALTEQERGHEVLNLADAEFSIGSRRCVGPSWP